MTGKLVKEVVWSITTVVVLSSFVLLLFFKLYVLPVLDISVWGLFSAEEWRCNEYLRNRNQFLWIAFFALGIFTNTIMRGIEFECLALNQCLFGSKRANFLFSAWVIFILMASIFLRAWSLRVRHIYYVIIGNRSWTHFIQEMHVDPEVLGRDEVPHPALDMLTMSSDVSDRSQSDKSDSSFTPAEQKPKTENKVDAFFVRHKAALTSNSGLCFVSVALLLIYFTILAARWENFNQVRTIAGVFLALMNVASMCLVYGLPDQETSTQSEIVTACLFTFILNALAIISINVIQNDTTSVLVLQSLLSIQWFGEMLIFYVVEPRKYVSHKKAVVHMASAPANPTLSSATARDALMKTLSDVDSVTQFMQHCTKEMCTENLIALLEFKGYKRRIRKAIMRKRTAARSEKKLTQSAVTSKVKSATQFTSSLPRKAIQMSSLKKKKSLKASTMEPSTPESATSPKSTSLTGLKKKKRSSVIGEKLKLDNPRLFEEAISADSKSHLRRDMSMWDLEIPIKLTDFGVRSAIVRSRSHSWHEKARLLCDKYLEWNSSLALNVSYENRSVALSLAGEHASVSAELKLAQLLFLFDGVVFDLIDNLIDVHLRFKRT
jgi:hypothetical protein